MSGLSGRRNQARIHQPIGVHMHTENDKRWRVARLRDFGWDGACLLTKEPLHPDTVVFVRMIASGDAGQEVLRGVVVWARPPKSGSKLSEYGIRFDHADERVQAVITDAIRQVLSRGERPSGSGERRKSRRGRASGGKIYFRVPSEGIVEWQPVQPDNLSIEGMSFDSIRSFLPGTPIQIRLTLDQTPHQVLVDAHVIWAHPANRGTMRYGVKVQSEDAEQQLMYETFVQFSV